MHRTLLLLATCLVFPAIAQGPARAPVLVELFTSEGCSSCPPADRQLQTLDSHAIVLSEHVDYWNQLGWKDKFSSEAYTQRQEIYTKNFGLNSPYTPQMVVDGAAQFTGGDSRRAAIEIGKASDRAKATIVLERHGAGVRLDIDNVPHEADIWLVTADDSDTTKVGAGENRGRMLTHVAVVRSMRKVGYVKRGGTYSHVLDLPGDAGGRRVIVFLQEAGQARVWGAAMLAAPEI